VTWAIEENCYSQRRACGRIGLDPKTYRYASRQPDDAAVRARLKGWRFSGGGSAIGGCISCCGVSASS